MITNIIEYRGRIHVFSNIREEPQNMFMKRTWFIVKNIEQEDIVNLSHCWINKEFKGVLYDDNIMKQLALCNSIYETIN